MSNNQRDHRGWGPAAAFNGDGVKKGPLNRGVGDGVKKGPSCLQKDGDGAGIRPSRKWTLSL